MPKKQLSKTARTAVVWTGAFVVVGYFSTPAAILVALGFEGPLVYGVEIVESATRSLAEPANYIVALGSIFSFSIMLLVGMVFLIQAVEGKGAAPASDAKGNRLPLEIADRLEKIENLPGEEPNPDQINQLCARTQQLFEENPSSEMTEVYTRHLDDVIASIILRRKIIANPGGVPDSYRRLALCSDGIAAYINIVNQALQISETVLAYDAEEAAKRLIVTDLSGESGLTAGTDNTIV